MAAIKPWNHLESSPGTDPSPCRTPANAAPLTPAAAEAMHNARGFAAQSLSPATLRAYRADWTHFQDWCRSNGFPALPATPTTVAAYLASQAQTHSRATIQRRLAAIGQAHKLKSQEWQPGHPVIRQTLRGMFRQHGSPRRKAAALGTTEIKKLIATCDDGLTGARDRGLLLIGFAGALRRAELVGIEREHLTLPSRGYGSCSRGQRLTKAARVWRSASPRA